NRRLAGRESFTVAPSRYLGHYVAGHLAATHAIEIRLTSTAAGGVTARIDVPNTALVDGAVPSALPVEAPAADVADEPILEDLRAPAAPQPAPPAPPDRPAPPLEAARPSLPAFPDPAPAPARPDADA